jgi:RNA-dependent RNA polymerase
VLGIIALNWLIIADQSRDGLNDPDCLTLAHLHSDAVDYPKTGQPVSLEAIPKLKFRAKPDWNAPETINTDSANYYESQRAIGRLFRDIDLPALRTTKRSDKYRRQMEPDELTLEDMLEGFHLAGEFDDPVHLAVKSRVSDLIDIPLECDETIENTMRLFDRYVWELRTICHSHTLSSARFASLTEEEAVIGTIVAKCSQPRKRRDLMAKMRDLTDRLVRSVKEEFVGEDDGFADSLERAWVAWKVSLMKSKEFGAKSFGWIALSGIFDAIKGIEDAVRGR